MKKENSAGRVTIPTGATNHEKAAQPTSKGTPSKGIPVVFAVLYLATGSAIYDWLVVRTCPFCGHAHRHLRLEQNAQTIERSPSCAAHRSYLVKVSDVVPARRTGRAA